MEKPIYQILYRGVSTNKITLENHEKYEDYRHSLKQLEKNDYLKLIQTNIFYI